MHGAAALTNRCSNHWHHGRHPTPSASKPCIHTLCQAVPRRASLIKQREKLPAKQRKRQKYQDTPRPIKALPGTPEFAGTLLTAINSANGPIQLLDIARRFGRHLPAQHVCTLLSRLAGFLTTGGLAAEQEGALQECCRVCMPLLHALIADASPLDLARAAYSMHRLKQHDKVVLSAVVEASWQHLGSFQADALSGLIAALGGAGHVPPSDWLHRFCLESYVRMPRFTAQDLANALCGLAQVGHVPSAEWLERAQRRLREVVPISGVNPPSLVKFGWALARLQVQPSFNWMLFFTGEARQRIDLFTARELSTLAWICAQLKHTPDPLFIDAWYKAATRRMATFNESALVLGLHSAACWGLDEPPPPPFLRALMPHSQALITELTGPQMVQLLWSCVGLHVRPDETWMQTYADACERVVGDLSAAQLSDLTWSFARLRYQPSEEWEAAAAAQVSKQLADFTPAQLGILLWAWRSVQLPVPPLWDQLFMTAAQRVYSKQQLQDVAALLGVLADHNTAQARRKGAGQAA